MKYSNLLTSMSVIMLVSTGSTQVVLGESSPTDKQIREVIGRAYAEEHAGRSDLEECNVSRLDVDGDGLEEALFSFPVGAHGSHAWVVTWVKGEEKILFDEVCDAPTAGFVSVSGAPTVLLEYSDYKPSYVSSSRTQKLYVWNGKAFAHVPSYDCILKHHIRKEGPYEINSDTADHCLLKRESIASMPCSAVR